MQKYKQLTFETNKGTFGANVFLDFNPMELRLSAIQESVIIGSDTYYFRCKMFCVKRIIDKTPGFEKIESVTFEKMNYGALIEVSFMLDQKMNLGEATKFMIDRLISQINSVNQWEVEE